MWRGTKMTDFKTWFEQKYIDWLSKRGKRGSIREFAELLGVDQKLVANWMRGDRKPGPDYADKIAIFLNYDLTIYDLLGLPRPDKQLLKIKALWPNMNERERSEVGKLLDRVDERIEQHTATEAQRRPIPTPKPSA